MVQSAILYVPIYRDDVTVTVCKPCTGYCTCRLQSKNKTLP